MRFSSFSEVVGYFYVFTQFCFFCRFLVRRTIFWFLVIWSLSLSSRILFFFRQFWVFRLVSAGFCVRRFGVRWFWFRFLGFFGSFRCLFCFSVVEIIRFICQKRLELAGRRGVGRFCIRRSGGFLCRGQLGFGVGGRLVGKAFEYFLFLDSKGFF